jgi:hypothetical protein
MESIDLEKQVETLLATPQFEQPQFEQSLLKDVFSKSMLVSAAGTALSVNIGTALGNILPIAALPTGATSVLAGVLMQKFGGNNKLLKDLALGIIQGGIAMAITPLTNKLTIPSFSQKVKETTEELNPMLKGVMW